jgi:transglutaminase-like putative cysteine protease
VVLLDSVDVAISADSRMRTTRRYAVHVRSREGREAATLREVYVTSSGRVRSMRGWLIPASGASRDLGNDRIGDVALVDNDVYNEVRARVFDASDVVTDDSVVGIEVESEERLLYAQIEWAFDRRWPTLAARRALALPAGWTVKSLTFNHAAVTPQQVGTTFVWELEDLPTIPDEQWMPPRSTLAPRIAASLFGPAPGAPGQFATWADVSAWLQALSAPSARPHEAVASRTNALLAALPAGAATFDRVAAIARYAQGVQYVSIQTGLGRGGGYQPRPAEVVLQRNYGDCKDKAHLMRAMLDAIGIRSYLVSLFSGDRSYVRAEWPSPQQFNHAIIAIALPDAPPGTTAVLEHPTLGRLLIFDPTDEFTPLGDLPLQEQGSLALITAAQGGTLERLPIGSPAAHRVTRTIEARLGPAGELTAAVSERSLGAEAAARRAVFNRPREYEDLMQRRLSSSVPGARIEKLNRPPAATPHEFNLTWEIVAARYVQATGTLLLVRPPFNVGGGLQAPGLGARKTPLALEPASLEETVRLDVPAGLTIDEIPPATALETSFGRYSLRYSAESGRITAIRSLEVEAQTIAAENYESVRQFFEKIRVADTTPIVLKR